MVLGEAGADVSEYSVIMECVLPQNLQTQFGSRAHNNAPNVSKYWSIGARYWNGFTNYWKGKLGVFRVYNEVLDENDPILQVGESDQIVKLDTTIGFQQQKLDNRYNVIATILGAAPDTVEAWVKTSITDDATGTIYYMGVNTDTNEFAVQCVNKKLAFTCGGGNTVSSTLSDINDGNYHHIAVAYNGETHITFLVDYEIETVDLGVTLNTQSTTENNYVGIYNGSAGTDLWNGNIGLMRVYDDYITSFYEDLTSYVPPPEPEPEIPWEGMRVGLSDFTKTSGTNDIDTGTNSVVLTNSHFQLDNPASLLDFTRSDGVLQEVGKEYLYVSMTVEILGTMPHDPGHGRSFQTGQVFYFNPTSLSWANAVSTKTPMLHYMINLTDEDAIALRAGYWGGPSTSSGTATYSNTAVEQLLDVRSAIGNNGMSTVNNTFTITFERNQMIVTTTVVGSEGTVTNVWDISVGGSGLSTGNYGMTSGTWANQAEIDAQFSNASSYFQLGNTTTNRSAPIKISNFVIENGYFPP